MHKEQNQSTSRKKFGQHIPPWKSFNRLLKKVDFNYRILDVKEEEFATDLPFRLNLINTLSNIPIDVSSLSSGEQVIFGLMMKLFTSSYYGNKLVYPGLLILDEPDAHLHPEMTQILINVLNDTFVDKLGIKVIITTHAPSTVALSPDESVYELRNTPECSLKKIGKDKALEMLTEFIPNLSIDYKNHKQIFVESETDGNYFNKIYDTLKRNNHELKSPLYFIVNPMGKGNSDVVKNIIKQFQDADNHKIFGIIDWDQRNISKDFIYVHGEEKRHTIENYLFDPIYLATLFLENSAHEIHSITGITKEENPYKIIELPVDKQQSISDQLLSEVEGKFPILKEKKNLQTVTYLNDQSLKLPEWFLLSKHTEIIEKFVSTFSYLEGVKQKIGEGKIQEELTRVICRCYPMIPKDTVELLTKISNLK